ncbi:hypothetical protein M408DRAFT_227307, partial [Serendipita vermifera MAFF 305830]
MQTIASLPPLPFGFLPRLPHINVDIFLLYWMDESQADRAAVRLLVLDGGGVTAISQLRILQEFMSRVNYERACPLLPCDYFDMIVGSGTGGVIAVLLVVFRLSAKEAMYRFFDIYQSVIGRNGETPSFMDEGNAKHRTDRLKRVICDLLELHRLPEDEPLLDRDQRRDTCLVVICVASVVDMSICRKFKNYRGREYSPWNPTVMDAICATVASPLLFDPVRIGELGSEECFVSCKFYFSNPTKQALQEACEAFGSDQQVYAIVSLGCGKTPPAAIAGSMDAMEYTKILEIVASDSEQVAEDMERQIGPSDSTQRRVFYRFSLDHVFDQVGGQRHHEILLSYTERYLGREIVNKRLAECIDACHTPGRATLEDLTRFREHFIVTHGLPPLPMFPVKRDAQLKQMEVLLFQKWDRRPVVVVSGMPGSGKSQLVNQFVRDCLPRLPIAIWVDASSVQTIHSTMIARVRELGRKCDTIQDARSNLAHWDERHWGPWVLIFDNADDQSIRLHDYFPSDDHGFIIVTTRDELRGNLSPNAHIKLSSMSQTEAVQTFINSAFLGKRVSEDEGLESERIVETLGHLPLAIHQAGCYVRERDCFWKFRDRLRESQPTILARPIHESSDRYRYSVGDVFNLTVQSLPKQAQQFLSLLSCAHHTDFPQSLISLAAEHHFRLDSYETMVNRTDKQMPEIEALYTILCYNHQWNEDKFDDLLEALRKVSLVTITHSKENGSFLSIHPLLHSWMKDRLSPTQKKWYRAAMARLLACGASRQAAHIHEFMASHINTLAEYWREIHVNDRASFADLLAFPGIADDTVSIWESVHKDL